MAIHILVLEDTKAHQNLRPGVQGRSGTFPGLNCQAPVVRDS